MKVLHIQKVKGIGGSERHLLDLLPALGARGVQVRMCVLGSHDYERFATPLLASGVETIVENVESQRPPQILWRIHQQIRRFRPSLVHTHLIHADLYGQTAAQASRVPALSSVHSTHSFYGREPYRTAARAAGHMARRVIAISDYVAQFVTALRLARRGAVRVIPYGIEPGAWDSLDRDRNGVRHEIGVANESIVVVIASRLIPGKGHGVLIEAIRLAIREVPELSLVVAGEGPLKGELEQTARDLPDKAINFLGFVPDMRSLLHACDIVAFPTLPELSEGFGLAALEAMASGRPVVATDVGPLPELVGDGRAGVIVRPGSPEDLAEALVRLASDEKIRTELGDNGRRVAETNYSLKSMVDRTLALYQELL